MADWKMTDEVARVEIDGLENGRRTKNEGLTLMDLNLQDWKMTDRLITVYKAGGVTKFEILLPTKYLRNG